MNFVKTLQNLKTVEGLTTLTNPDELLFLYKTTVHLKHKQNVRLLDCGTYSGVSAMIMAQAIVDYKIDGHIDTVDDYSRAGEGIQTIQAIVQRLGYGKIISVIESDDIAFINQVPNQHYNLAYVDSLHQYAHVLALLHCLLPKMKPLSYLLGHDYCLAEPNVMQAVDQWRMVHEHSCVGFGLTGRIWWTAIKETGCG